MKELLLSASAITIPWPETIEMHYLKFWSPEVQSQRYWQGSPLLEALDEEGLFFASLGFPDGFRRSMACGLHNSSFCLRLCLCVSNLPHPFLKGHLPFDL